MKNVIGYIRVSTDGQCKEDKFGLEVQREQILEYCEKIKQILNTEVYIDLTAKTSADKKWDWVRKGAPIRLEIGLKEVENNSIFYVRRDKLLEKNVVMFNEFISNCNNILQEMQINNRVPAKVGVKKVR